MAPVLIGLHHPFNYSFLLLLVFTLAINSVFSARIAGFHTTGGSQYINTRNILAELATRGHEVMMVVPSSFDKMKPSQEVPHRIYQAPYKPGFLEETLVPLELEGKNMEVLFRMSKIQETLCESALNSTELLKELENYDLLIYDSGAFCAALIGELLKVQRVELFPYPPNSPDAFYHMIPSPISYVPQLPTGFTDKMTYMERLTNLGSYIGERLFLSIVYNRPMNALKMRYNITAERSFEEAVADVELLLIMADFALEYPQPLLPGHIMVGPLNVKDAQPLPPDLEEFVSNSRGHGFIIVSFGSMVASILPKEKVDMLAEAFGKVKQKVVWRLKGYIPSSLHSNIKAVQWLPQNDLLAHKDIKAFVSHVGHNSLYESAYHGVPVVAFPLGGDQDSNAKKAEHLGLGLSVDHKKCSAQQLFKTIETVVGEPQFQTKAMHISRLLKDRRYTPLQETCNWIEYVVRHGGAQHLRAQVFNIPWYQYYLLDVMAFLVAIVTLVIMVIRFICRCLCRICCKKGDIKTKEE
ncbi:LOW QUALITY PROTEIN: UDP-glucuronosyltransferase 2C1-like [Stylophora pistillata]|uniref:LOW QUALITY PROTEIN: UDP-glucuronosyltransferase 2C1-like n=1 Tax=Stylophora pistillata TaxID=50429 RepID=UPI000C03A919|nr:LOW QUALITY PROTEIN: UDP-glucuronosyltransferase 2C1-like [Stylophora pistillata]